MRKFIFILLMTFATLCHAQETANVWVGAAKSVCDQINQALTYYTQGDIQTAQSKAIMAYFRSYDAEIEPAVRITLGASHVFEVEHQFRDFKNTMKNNPDKKQLEEVSSLAKKLCETMYADAKALHEAKVEKQVFKVD